MTSDIGPGDFLEAVQDIANAHARLDRGRIYTCDDAVPVPLDACTLTHPGIVCFGVTVKEAPIPYPWLWCSELFRPVRRPDTDKLLRRVGRNAARSVEGPTRQPPVASIVRGGCLPTGTSFSP